MPPTQNIPLADVEHLDFTSLAKVDPRCRLDVVVDDVVVPLLVVPKTGARRVLVLSNGAVDQSVANGSAVFQRSSWNHEIEHHQIFVSDPATAAPECLSLAWGHLEEGKWAAEAIGRAVRAVASALGVTEHENRAYFGSSAGGFMSLALLADDPGARAVVNNAQFDWTRWMPTGVNALRHARFGGKLPATIRKLHPLSSNVLTLLAGRNEPLTVDYHVNVASTHDRQQDLPLFEAFVRAHPDLCGNVRIHRYFHSEHGHNPMPKADTLRVLNHAFEDPGGPAPEEHPSVDEGHGTSPVPIESGHDVTTHLSCGRKPLRYEVVPEARGMEPLEAVLTDTPGADTLVVVFHGLVDRHKYTLPRFERFDELRNLPHHMLFMSDPTLRKDPSLRIGWYVGTEEDPVPERLATHISSVAEALGVQKIVLTGSCGGGFAALALAPRIPGALALAFSPDTRPADYVGGGPLSVLVATAFPSIGHPSALAEAAPSLIDLTALYASTTTGQAWYIQNSGDDVYVASSMEPFRDISDDRVQFVLEHHCRGHNPPTPNRMRTWISYAVANWGSDPQDMGHGVGIERRR